MALIDLYVAKSHLRLEPDYPDEQVEPYLLAAELSAAEFLNRRLFEDEASLAAAVANVSQVLVAAGVAYQAALTEADAIDDTTARDASREYACTVYRRAQDAARETRDGMVATALIRAAILRTLGSLFENRQDIETGVTVALLPVSAKDMLMPYRVGMGV